jgi:hypothetical protein
MASTLRRMLSVMTTLAPWIRSTSTPLPVATSASASLRVSVVAVRASWARSISSS